MGFIEVSNPSGEKQHIPEEWLDHPVLKVGFKKTPSARGAEAKAASAATQASPQGDKE